MKKYSIIIEPEAQLDLESIYKYITQKDTATKAKTFLGELKAQIQSLDSMPFRCRKSYYTDDQDTYDLIYKGYTIVFKVIVESVYILTIFRQRNF